MAKLVMILLLILTLLTHQIMIIDCSKGVCIEAEKQALVSFKRDLNDPQNVLSSWVTKEEEDCCKWDRIVCDNVTGNIVELNLTDASLSGKINPSLLNLKHLTHLNLSYNNFEPGIQIPTFLGSLVSLRYLNLRYTGYFVGMIPQQLGNLSNLQHLEITGTNLLHSKSLHWISGLSSLEYLYMSSVNLSEASDHWLLAINNLPSLVELYLPSCELRNSIHLPSRVNLTSLRVLDLSSNSFEGVLPNGIANLTSIVSLDLSRNSLQGNIPMSMGNLCNLEKLDLYNNKHNGNLSEAFERLSSGCLSNMLNSLRLDNNAFSGHISDQIVEFKHLSILSIASNKISGPIPVSLGSLSNLEDLDISSNLLTGVVSEAHFAGLVNLYTLRASGNSLTLRVSPDWIPPFQLNHLDLGSWNLGPHFPPWLNSQSDIGIIRLSNTGISGIIPDRLWNFSSNIPWLDLSHNKIRGRIPDLHNAEVVDLSSNEFTGPLPGISSELWWLDLSNNSLSGDIRGLLCNPKGNNDKLSLSVLRLGDNLLAGEIPDCWSHWPWLTVIDLGDNNLSGDIPISIGLFQSLNSLNLRNNSLTGEIPNSLTNNRFSLVGLDLGLNKLAGSIPIWMGIMSLRVLVLRSNSLNGHFPVELCALSELQILDVADNNLSGTIPTDCFINFKAMTDTNQVYSDFFYGAYLSSDLTQVAKESAIVATKGREYQYDTILYLMSSLDLSSNNFSGEIPEEIANLQALKSLNFSGNRLGGRIPSKIGNMSALESLDLSRNRLSGEIPRSMSDLNFLNHLNLSYNDLSGEIPKSTQLQSLSSSSFLGNRLLCGDPLPKRCRETSTETNQEVEDDDNGDEEFWFRLGLAMGFVVSFVGVIAPLVLFKFWRRAYFWFFQEFVWYNILDGITRLKYKIGVSTPAHVA